MQRAATCQHRATRGHTLSAPWGPHAAPAVGTGGHGTRGAHGHDGACQHTASAARPRGTATGHTGHAKGYRIANRNNGEFSIKQLQLHYRITVARTYQNNGELFLREP